MKNSINSGKHRRENKKIEQKLFESCKKDIHESGALRKRRNERRNKREEVCIN